MRSVILGSLKNNKRNLKKIKRAYHLARKKLTSEFGDLPYDVVFCEWREAGEDGFYWYLEYDFVKINIGNRRNFAQETLTDGICEAIIHNFIADNLDYSNNFLNKIVRNGQTAALLGWQYDEKYHPSQLSPENLAKIREALSGKVDEDWLYSTKNGWHFYGFSKFLLEELALSYKEISQMPEAEFKKRLLKCLK